MSNCRGRQERKVASTQYYKIEIDRYGFFEANTDISADTNISKILKSCFLLH